MQFCLAKHMGNVPTSAGSCYGLVSPSQPKLLTLSLRLPPHLTQMTDFSCPPLPPPRIPRKWSGCRRCRWPCPGPARSPRRCRCCSTASARPGDRNSSCCGHPSLPFPQECGALLQHTPLCSRKPSGRGSPPKSGHRIPQVHVWNTCGILGDAEFCLRCWSREVLGRKGEDPKNEDCSPGWLPLDGSAKQ